MTITALFPGMLGADSPAHRYLSVGLRDSLRPSPLYLTIACICMYDWCMANSMKLQSLPCYCATLRQAARAATAMYEGILGDSGLRATQYTALQVLKLVPNITTTELAEAIGIDQTTATRTLALIKKSGLALNVPGSDRRERRWALTAAGEATFRSLRPKWEAAQAALEKRLGRVEAAALKKAAYVAASKLAAD
jgi:DNA-binding MarR family transcriptional regulator